MKDPDIMARGDLFTGSIRRRERKVHSLVDKGVQADELGGGLGEGEGATEVPVALMAEDLAAFEASLDANLDRLHRELRDGKYVPQPVLQHLIPKAGQPGEVSSSWHPDDL